MLTCQSCAALPHNLLCKPERGSSVTGVPCAGTMPLETALLQDMRHDSIVSLLRHKSVTMPQDEGQLWMVMEFGDNGPLYVRGLKCPLLLTLHWSAEHLWLIKCCVGTAKHADACFIRMCLVPA